MIQLKWYARAVVTLACALIVSSIWMFFSITNLMFHFSLTSAINLGFAVVSTTILYFATLHMHFKASKKEQETLGLE